MAPPPTKRITGVGSGLQEGLQALHEVEAGVGGIGGVEIGWEEQELDAGIEAAKFLEGGSGGLDAGAADYGARLHGGEKRGSVGEVAGGLDLEAGAIEDRGHVGEEIAGRIDAKDLGIGGGPGVLFARHGTLRERCERFLFG
jgi:hypothetical protein